MLDKVVELMPSPVDIPPVEGELENGETATPQGELTR